MGIFTAKIIFQTKKGREIRIWIFPLVLAVVLIVVGLLWTFKPISNIKFRKLYNEVYSATNERLETLEINDIPSENIRRRVSYAIYNGDPSNMAVSEISYKIYEDKIVYSFEYFDYGINFDDAMKELSAGVDEIVSQMPQNLSDEQKIRWANDYICANFDYDYENMRSNALCHTPWWMLKTKKGVCSAYAALFEMIMDRCGIPCKTVCGHSGDAPSIFSDSDINHGWNIVRLGLFWYHIDVTWNDTEDSPNEYFLVSDDYMKTHYHSDWADADNFSRMCFFNKGY